MIQSTAALSQGSAAVINNNDQFEVFNNPQCSDPTHSFASKDHFALILNECAGMSYFHVQIGDGTDGGSLGQLAVVIVRHVSPIAYIGE
jgi:hypothetical protein